MIKIGEQPARRAGFARHLDNHKKHSIVATIPLIVLKLTIWPGSAVNT